MVLKKPEEYVESLRKTPRRVYVFGELVTDVTKHPNLQAPMRAIMKMYELALDPRYKEVFTATSEWGDIISRFLHIARSVEDLAKRVEMMRIANRTVGTCNYRCTGHDVLNALYIVTYEIDGVKGTNYHERFKRYLKYLQDNDMAVHGAMTDARGDRSRRPKEQKDPDMYVRVVEERKDGIVVRGAKVHQSGASVANEIVVVPTRSLLEDEKEYAIAFAVPAHERGVIHILQWNSYEAMRWLRREFDVDVDLGNPSYGLRTTGLIIFDDVFVPWNRVFMFGETEFAGKLVEYFTCHHRGGGAGCKAGFADVILGATLLAVKSIGVERAGHIRDKIGLMVYHDEINYALGLAAAYTGVKTKSGAYIPNPKIANIAKLAAVESLSKMIMIASELSGALTITAPSIADLKNKDIGRFVDKYLKTTGEFSTEDRLKIYKFLQSWLASPHLVGVVHGGGPPQTQIIALQRLIDYKEFMENVAKIIGVKLSK